MTQRFEGATALITGAAGGFGRLLAAQLSAAGARLILSDLDAGALEAVAASAPGPVETLAGDIALEATAEALVRKSQTRFGRLDIAVNNAGVLGRTGRIEDTLEADFDRMIAVNAKGVLFGMKHQIRAMEATGGGVILNVASVAGIAAAPKLAAYAAAKHAVVGLTKTAAVETARRNIRVNAICPYFSPTAMVSESDIADRVELFAQGAPMKRLAAPEEVVAAMILLLDPANSFMTGQAVAVDGGLGAI